MIELDGLTKRYRARLAVDDLTVTIEPGRVTGFLGPNGSGKTTTMRCILGLTRPTAGTATVLGRPYRELARPLCRVGALIDPRARHPGRTAYAHLLALAQSNGLPRHRVRRSSSWSVWDPWPTSGSAGSPSAWASVSASPPPCWVIRRCCCSTSR